MIIIALNNNDNVFYGVPFYIGAIRSRYFLRQRTEIEQIYTHILRTLRNLDLCIIINN